MITVTYNDNGLNLNLSRAPKVMQDQLVKWMTRVVEHIKKAVAKNIREGQFINNRSGNLANAIISMVTVTPENVVGEVWPDLTKAPYGDIQEVGGTITPKRAQHLTIPLEALAGTKATASEVISNPGAFGFKSTFVPKGKSVIMGNFGGGEIVPLFALKRFVVIPAHRYISGTFEQELPWILEALENATDEATKLIFEVTTG